MKPLFLLIPLLVVSCNLKKVDNPAAEPARDSLIIAERIDGPANIRDTISGSLLFTLNDNVVVSATEPQNKWLKIGVLVDLTQKQMDNLLISKGSKLYVEGKEIGVAAGPITLTSASKTNDRLIGELTGYTSVSNIKPTTVPENVFESIVNSHSSPLTINDFKRYLKDFQFNDFENLLPGFKGYEIDENWIDDPSPLLRVWLLFKSDELYGVFHSRPLQLNAVKSARVGRGFYYSSFNNDPGRDKELIDAFNVFIGQAD